MATYTEQVRQMPQRGLEQTKEMVSGHPLSSAVAVLGLGFGIGLVLGMSLSGPLGMYREPERSTAERLGRHVMDTLAGVLPDSVSSRIF